MLACVANDTSVSNFMELVYYINESECFFLLMQNSIEQKIFINRVC